MMSIAHKKKDVKKIGKVVKVFSKKVLRFGTIVPNGAKR
jgi:hypothetical protein